MKTEIEQKQHPNWLAIAIYYALACGVSWPFFWQRDMLGRHVSTFSYMWGPGIAAIVVLILFRKSHRRTITFFGTSAIRSLLFYFIPTIAITLGVILTGHTDAFEGMQPWLAPLLFPLVGYFMVLGEELGWRGFLQDAARPLPQMKRYVLIGGMWEFWHFTTRTTHRPPLAIALTLLVSYSVVIILSWIIGKATERTKSLTVAIALHSSVDIAFEFPMLITFVILALSLPVWWLLLKDWPKPNAAEASPALETVDDNTVTVSQGRSTGLRQ